MLGYLKGTLQERDGNELLILVGGVGYLVKTPDHPRYDASQLGDSVDVYVHSHIREDAFDLYGFKSASEKKLFNILMSVSGVGPKLALTLLSQGDPAALVNMILSEDKDALTSISGVGKKTAERMILELRDSLKKKLESNAFDFGSSANATSSNRPSVGRASELYVESYLALQGLGYKEVNAKQMVETALIKLAENSQKPAMVEDVIRFALKTPASP